MPQESESLQVVILEPYYGGSHAAFVDTLSRYSRHQYSVVTMPARKWKWRMRGAALWFAREDPRWMGHGGGRATSRPDVILCNDMLSVADLKALLGRPLRDVPIICYFHENQLTYPIPNEEDRDYQYGMTNITSCLASDAVWFNSSFHREGFLAAAQRLLGKMPDCVPSEVVEDIRKKSAVLYPPVSVDIDGLEDTPAALHRSRPAVGGRPLTILWPHRWEYDKNPEPFFEALIRLDEGGSDFRLAMVGEQFRTAPPAFAAVHDRLKAHVVHEGYLASRDEYLSLLAGCDVVVSTAIQENFGIAVVEAILLGCQPLLPNRLAYPELIPPGLHSSCLYSNDTALYPRLRELASGRGLLDDQERQSLHDSVKARFGRRNAVEALDEALTTVARGVHKSGSPE